jgi:hypothetical protein
LVSSAFPQVEHRFSVAIVLLSTLTLANHGGMLHVAKKKKRPTTDYMDYTDEDGTPDPD